MNPQQPVGYSPHQSMFPAQRSSDGVVLGPAYPPAGVYSVGSEGGSGYPPGQGQGQGMGQGQYAVAGAPGLYGQQQGAPYYQEQLSSDRDAYTGGGFPLKAPPDQQGYSNYGQQAAAAVMQPQPQQTQSLNIPTFRAISDRVREIVTAHTLDECGGRVYTPAGAQDLATGLAERCMMHLRDVTGGTYKIIVSASILQRAGAGLHTVSTCYWDAMHDATVTVRLEFPSFIALVTVFGLKME